MGDIERRTLLAAGLAAAASGLTGCDDKKPPVRGASDGTPRPFVVPQRAWAAFEESLDGDLVRPGERGFRSAKLLYNPRFDPVRPRAVVRAASSQDVVEAIRFAQRHGLPLVPRSGGHSYVGASTVQAGIQLDLRALHDVRPDGHHVHAGAGARLFDVHAALERRERTLPTGTCPTVGATGLTLGGGNGVESRAYGLTCDALTEVELVTADGRVRIVSSTEDPDLFWACKGGGGGSFGVATRLTYRTFPADTVGFFFLYFDDADAAAVIRGWLRRQRRAPRSSWSNVHLDAQSGGGINLRIVGVSLTGDGHAEAAALERAIGVAPTNTSIFTRSHGEATKLLAGCSTLADAECHLAPAGKLQRESFAAGSDVLAPGLRAVDAVVAQVRARGRAGRGGALILDPLGGAVSDGTGAFPWRGAAAIAQWYVGLPATASSSEVDSAYSWIRGGHRAFGSDSIGGYVNYLEPRRSSADYFGTSLGRLRDVKRAVDPEDFFHTRWSIRPR